MTVEESIRNESQVRKTKELKRKKKRDPTPQPDFPCSFSNPKGSLLSLPPSVSSKELKRKFATFRVGTVRALIWKSHPLSYGSSSLVLHPLSTLEVKTSIFKTLRPSASDGISPRVAKYWYQRYSLFSRYDDGIKMDEEGWFSVTPEDIAIRHAERSGPGAVIDCFAGVGGNSNQFARRCNYVLAIEIDPQKVGMAFNNAKIYGVENYIDFIVGDFFQLAPFLKGGALSMPNPELVREVKHLDEMTNKGRAEATNIISTSNSIGVFLHIQGDVVFLSPPWGGPTYSEISKYTLDLLKPKDGYSMFQVAQRITPNVIMFLPRNVDSNQVEELSWLSSPPLNVEIEESFVGSYMKGVSAYFGDTAGRSPALS